MKSQVWPGVKTDNLRAYFSLLDDLVAYSEGKPLCYGPFLNDPYPPDLLRDGRLFNFGLGLQITFEG